MAEIKICPQCKTQNPEAARFCRNCGKKLVTGEDSGCESSNLNLDKLKQYIASLQNENKYLLGKLNNHNNKKYIHYIYSFFLIVCSIVIVFLFNEVEKKNRIISELIEQNESQFEILNNNNLNIQRLENKSNELSSALNETKEEIKELSSVYPFIITSVDIKNDGEEYGEPIYEKNTTYIYDKINIKSYYTGSVTIYVKFYRADGELSKNDKSPAGYSYSQQINLKKGVITYSESTGWGNKNKGFWKSGQYYMEFWYNNKCFYKKRYYINS